MIGLSEHQVKKQTHNNDKPRSKTNRMMLSEKIANAGSKRLEKVHASEKNQISNHVNHKSDIKIHEKKSYESINDLKEYHYCTEFESWSFASRVLSEKFMTEACEYEIKEVYTSILQDIYDRARFRIMIKLNNSFENTFEKKQVLMKALQPLALALTVDVSEFLCTYSRSEITRIILENQAEGLMQTSKDSFSTEIVINLFFHNIKKEFDILYTGSRKIRPSDFELQLNQVIDKMMCDIKEKPANKGFIFRVKEIIKKTIKKITPN